MRITKWTVDFDSTADVPIVPIWIALPGFPIHLHRREALFEIVRPVGTPIKLDVATSDGLRPSVARICVEVDVSQELPQKIYLQAKSRYILHPIIYEDLPLFCATCRRLGHALGACSTTPSSIPPLPPPPPFRPKAQRWTPVKKKKVTEPSLQDPPITTPVQEPPTASINEPVQTREPEDETHAEIFCDAPEPPLSTHPLNNDFGHSSDTELPPEDATVELRSVPEDLVHRMQLLPPSPDDEVLISCLQESPTEADFIPVVPRRKRRARKDLPPLPPSAILTRSASHAIQGSDTTLSQ